MGRSGELGGVAVHVWMRLSDVDRPPLGDVAASVATMVVTNPEIEFRVDLTDDGSRVSLRGTDIPERFGELTAFQEAHQ